MCNVRLPLLAVSVLLLSCSSDKVTSPDNSSETPETVPALRGTVLVADTGINKRSVIITVSDGTLSLTTRPDSLGVYRFDELPEGTYTLTAASSGNTNSRFYPTHQYVNVGDDPCLADDIITYRTNMNRPVIVCRFTTTSDVPVYGLMCSMDGDGVYKKERINSDGLTMFEEVKIGRSYVLRTVPDYGNFTVTPGRVDITVEDSLTVADFHVVNEDEETYSVSGRIVNAEGNGVEGIVLDLEYNSIKKAFTVTDSEGCYFFVNIRNGIYAIRLYSSELNLPSRTYFDVNGADVVIPDIKGTNPLTLYVLKGNILGMDGNGIPGVNVSLNCPSYYVMTCLGDTLTAADGSYTFEVEVGYSTFETLVVVPDLEGYAFTPESVECTLAWLMNEPDGGVIELPPMTGIDYSSFAPEEYFPLTLGSEWLYDRSVDGGEANRWEVSIEELLLVNGASYYRFSAPGPWGLTEFAIIDNAVYALDGGAFKLLEFGVTPGTDWSDTPQQHWYSYHGEYLGFETVTVPAGIEENCQHYVSSINYGPESRETWDIWLQRNIGIVKMSKVLETSQGTETLDYQLRTAIVPCDLK